MIHYAICMDYGKGRNGFVMSFENESAANKALNNSDKRRIGYVGCPSFQEAVTRAGMMERNEPNAWGVLS